VFEGIWRGIIVACHDCSEGGLGVALAEMCLAGELGADVLLSRVPVDDASMSDASRLFAESNGRYLVEVPASRAAEFERHLEETPYGLLGYTKPEAMVSGVGVDGSEVFSLSLAEVRAAWRGHIAAGRGDDA
jgi:phosphoribosylformylglycinamidine synthase